MICKKVIFTLCILIPADLCSMRRITRICTRVPKVGVRPNFVTLRAQVSLCRAFKSLSLKTQEESKTQDTSKNNIKTRSMIGKMMTPKHEIGTGFGKVILFGEHFVVHDLPAIVAGLPWCTTASVNIIKKWYIKLHDERPRIAGVKFLADKKYAYDQLVQNILEKMGITDGITITLAGDLAVSSGGIGASAATSVAITRALNKLYNFKLSDHEINEIALHGERAVHGNPSGIDNTAATYGGLFVFQKNTAPRFIEQTNRLDIVLIDSGFTTPTPDVIASVRSFKEKNPELTHAIISKYKTIVQEAEHILSEKLDDNPDNLVRLGTLMNQNHALLQQLGVSTPELDQIVSCACTSGALGAKITGTGRGGLILALTPGDIQERVAKKFRDLGYNVLTATLNMGVLYSNIKRDNIIFKP